MQPKRQTNPHITEELISTLVHHFYDLVQKDERLGPIFDQGINDWPKHLNIMCDFWSSIVLKTGRFHGSPMVKHQALIEHVEPEDFMLWLGLFKQAVSEVCPPQARSDFLVAAQRIAHSLKMGMFEVDFDLEKIKDHVAMTKSVA